MFLGVFFPVLCLLAGVVDNACGANESKETESTPRNSKYCNDIRYFQISGSTWTCGDQSFASNVPDNDEVVPTSSSYTSSLQSIQHSITLSNVFIHVWFATAPMCIRNEWRHFEQLRICLDWSKRKQETSFTVQDQTANESLPCVTDNLDARSQRYIPRSDQ